jgi:hypothetical protein
MSDTSYETLRRDLLQHLAGSEEGSEEYTNTLKQLEILNKAEAAQKEPETPEPTGAKAWFEKHSESLIRVGGTLGTVIMIGFVESKFDVIFRSKASKYL